MGHLSNTKGMTLAEVMVGVLIATLLFGSLILSALAVRTLSVINRHSIQAINAARGALETIKGQGYGAAVNSSWQRAYDAGPDALFGTADDLVGTVTLSVRDYLDMDADEDLDEALIDVDGDGANDAARPVRVTFTWQEVVKNQNRNFSVWFDTLMAA
jgi:hypothetical protein